MIKKIQFTQSGMSDLQAELIKLKAARVPAVVELQRAREMGDLSENAAYHVARSRLSRIDSNIRRIEKVLKQAVVVEPPNDGYIDIGSCVKIDDGEKTKEIILVDGYESDFMKGKISVYSPIGKELRGKRKGDKINVATHAGKNTFLIK